MNGVTIRKLVANGHIKSVRAGEGRNGMIPINKDEFLADFGT